jgi:hypothetical protein
MEPLEICYAKGILPSRYTELLNASLLAQARDTCRICFASEGCTRYGGERTKYSRNRIFDTPASELPAWARYVQEQGNLKGLTPEKIRVPPKLQVPV